MRFGFHWTAGLQARTWLENKEAGLEARGPLSLSPS
jgi:hypothetical protein